MTPIEFRTIRLKNRITQEQLADFLDLTRMTIFKYEKGRDPIPKPIGMIMDLIDCGLISKTDVVN